MEKSNDNYRWYVLGAVLFTYFLIVTQRTAPGLITDRLMHDFGVTASAVGIMASVQFLAYAGLQMPMGLLSDRFGPNYFLIAGTLLNGLGTLLYSLASHESVLLLARLLVGIGDAAIWVNLVLILSQWFKPREFIQLIGLAGVSGSLGFLAATAPLSLWIASSGWRVPFFATGMALCAIGIVLYFVLVRQADRHPAPGRSSAAGSSLTRLGQAREPTWRLLRRILSNRQSWGAFLCHFGLVGTYIGFIGSWAVPYGMEIYGMTRSGASQIVMIGLIGALAGAPLSTWMAGRLGSMKRPYMAIHLVAAACWAAIFLSGGKPSFVMLAVLFWLIGYGNGASALTFAIVRESYPIREVGIASGFANTGGFVSAILLPSLFGEVLDHYRHAAPGVGYHYGFAIPALFSLIGLFGAVLLREPQQAE